MSPRPPLLHPAGRSTRRPWFESAFGSDYLRVYAHRDAVAARREVDFLCRRGVRGDVLDLCCGAGRHLAALVERGRRAVGLDLSRDLLCHGVRTRPSLAGRTLHGDARALPFADARFDWVVCLFSSFGYWGPRGDAAVLAEVARVLRPGGGLALDLPQPAHVRTRLVPVSRRTIDGVEVHERRRLHAGGRSVVKRVRLSEPGRAPRRWREHLRLYDRAELDALLDRAGLRVEATHGDFDGSPASSEHPRLIAIARRAP